MLIRAAIATALIAASAPALASDYDAKARQAALNRCAMNQYRIPAGKTVTAPIVKCEAAQRANRDEVAFRDAKRTDPNAPAVMKD